MDYTKKELTFTWKIENFSMLPHQNGEKLRSPVFVADKLEKTKWCIDVYPKGSLRCHGLLSGFLTSLNSRPITVSYSLMLESTVGSSSVTSNTESNTFDKEGQGRGLDKFASLKRIYEKKHLYLPQDVLTFKCHIRHPGESSLVSNIKNKSKRSLFDSLENHCSAHTRVPVQRRFITWTIKNINDLLDRTEETSISFTSAMKNAPSMNLSFYVSEDQNDDCCQIEISQIRSPSNEQRLFVKCKIKVISEFEKYQDSHESTHLFSLDLDDVWRFPPFIKRSYLTPEKYLYAHDALLLHCEFAFSHKDTEFHFDVPDYMPCSSETRKKPRLSELSGGIRSLYGSGKFCDVNLLAAGQTFPCHKLVLCARSPVFCAMFENDMKEKKTGVIEITDIEPDTMNRLLTYMHTDVVMKDLSTEDASLLFCAADKYQVVSLKRECSILLVSTLSVANVCDVLVLANAFEDNFLLTAVHNFIYCHLNETFNSTEWKSFMDRDPKLSGEIMLQMWNRQSYV